MDNYLFSCLDSSFGFNTFRRAGSKDNFIKTRSWPIWPTLGRLKPLPVDGLEWDISADFRPPEKDSLGPSHSRSLFAGNILTICSTNMASYRDDIRPDVIDDYNHGKGGVDVLDSRIDFTCKGIWPEGILWLFFLMLDVALVNPFLVLKESKENCTADRITFIRMVSESLASEFMVWRTL